MVAEVYRARPARRLDVARRSSDLRANPGVVDADWYVEDAQPKFTLRRPRESRAGSSPGGCGGACAPGELGRLRWPAPRRRGERRRTYRVRLPRASQSRGRPVDPVARLQRRWSCGELTSVGATRKSEHVSQEPAAGDLRYGRSGGNEREPGLRDPADEQPIERLSMHEGYRLELYTAVTAVRHIALRDEMGRRVAHHLSRCSATSASRSPPCWS